MAERHHLLNEHNGMTLISLTDINRVVMRDGKVGTEQECLCKCCNCAACECELDVTIGGVTFPADGQRRTLCIYDDGPAGTIFIGGVPIRMQSTKLWNRGPFGVGGIYDPDVGMAGMVSVSAVLQCDPNSSELDYGPETRPNQFRVILNVGYHQIVKIGGNYPQAGNLCGNWIDNASMVANATKVRVWQWGRCNDCGCPDSDPPTRLDSGYPYSDMAAPVECRLEYNDDTQTVPTFELDCGPCP